MSGKGKRILFLGALAMAALLFPAVTDTVPEMQAAGMGDTYTVTASDFRYNTREMPVGYFELSNGKMAFCAC